MKKVLVMLSLVALIVVGCNKNTATEATATTEAAVTTEATVTTDAATTTEATVTTDAATTTAAAK